MLKKALYFSYTMVFCTEKFREENHEIWRLFTVLHLFARSL